MKKSLSLTCTTLACLMLLVSVATAQERPGGNSVMSRTAPNSSRGASVPTSNPEPATWAAVLGGAAIAGGIAYRLRKRKR